jgi:hypothetical protein
VGSTNGATLGIAVIEDPTTGAGATGGVLGGVATALAVTTADLLEAVEFSCCAVGVDDVVMAAGEPAGDVLLPRVGEALAESEPVALAALPPDVVTVDSEASAVFALPGEANDPVTVVALTWVAPVVIEVVFGEVVLELDDEVPELDDVPVLVLDDVAAGLPDELLDAVEPESLSVLAVASAAAAVDSLTVLAPESVDELEGVDPASDPVSALATAAPIRAAVAMPTVSAPAPSHTFNAPGAEATCLRDDRCSSVDPPPFTAVPPTRDARPSPIVDAAPKNLRRERYLLSAKLTRPSINFLQQLLMSCSPDDRTDLDSSCQALTRESRHDYVS